MSTQQHDNVNETLQRNGNTYAASSFFKDEVVSPKEALRMLAIYPWLPNRHVILKFLDAHPSIDTEPSVDAIIEAGLLPILDEYLGYPHATVQNECCRILAYIVDGTPDQVQKAVDAGMISAFLKGVHSDVYQIANLCWWSLTCIIYSGGGAYRDRAIQCGIIDEFVKTCHCVSKCVNVFAVELSDLALRLCEYQNPQISRETQTAILPCLLKLIKNPNPQVIKYCCMAIAYLCTDDDDQLVFVNSFNVVDVVVSLLDSSNDSIVIQALFVCCAFARGSTKHAILERGFLSYVPRVFGLNTLMVHVHMCNVLANILTGNEYHVQAFYDAGLLPYLMEELNHEEFDVRFSAVWCFYEICESGLPQQVLQLGIWGILPIVTPFLATEHVDYQHNVLYVINSLFNASDELVSGHLFHFMHQFQENGGRDMLDSICLNGTDALRELADAINSFYVVNGPYAAA